MLISLDLAKKNYEQIWQVNRNEKDKYLRKRTNVLVFFYILWYYKEKTSILERKKNNMGTDGFQISNGVLKGYSGPNVSTLVIPEGVTTLENGALKYSNLQECKKIIFPKSLTCVGNRLLSFYYENLVLEELEFLGDVDCIGELAFHNVKLKKLTFHGKIGTIKRGAFKGGTFNKNSITELHVSEIKKIGNDAFLGCEKLREVHISKLGAIGEEAFFECKNLEVLDIPTDVTNIGDRAFAGCTKLKKDGFIIVNGVMFDNSGNPNIPEGVVKISKYACTPSKSGPAELISLPSTIRVINEQRFYGSIFQQPPAGMLQTEEKLGGTTLLDHIDSKWKLDKKDWAALYVFQTDKKLNEICIKHIEDNFGEYIAEMLPFLEKKGTAKRYQKVAELIIGHPEEIDCEIIRKFYEFASAKKMKVATDLLKPYVQLEQSSEETDSLAIYKKKYNEHLLDKSIKKNKGNATIFSKVRMVNSQEFAPTFLVKCAVVPYLTLYTGRPKHISGYQTSYMEVKFLEIADSAANMLNQEDLQNLVEKQYKIGNSAWLFPYGRYASGTQITSLISDMKKWESWYEYGATGRSNIITARGALMLSDTKEAMMNLDKKGLLGYYAKLRNSDEDSIRDTVLSEFGLDSSGKKEYNLGTKSIVVSLAQNLSFTIYDIEADKVVKSIPKKGTDAELVAKASADFSEMKKNLKKVVKSRNDILFYDFLSGKTRDAKSWTTSYTKNPILKRVAQLIVWNQGENTFILTEEEAIDCNGQKYEIKEDIAIGVAHPIEMQKDEIESWQKYFTSHGLKQPFCQIWEPAVEATSIKADRYAGFLIPFYRFRSQEKHGISVEDTNFHNEIYIYFEDCDADVERIDWSRHQINNDDRFEVKSFEFKEYTRQVNHIVSYLDKITIFDRILKDDVSISSYLDSFTLAQIMEFIKVASENKCINCLVVLMDYKNKKFEQYNPMDEFTLD